MTTKQQNMVFAVISITLWGCMIAYALWSPTWRDSGTYTCQSRGQEDATDGIRFEVGMNCNPRLMSQTVR